MIKHSEFIPHAIPRPDMHYPHLSLLSKIILCLTLWTSLCSALNAIKADPDYICTGFENSGVSWIKIGDVIELKFLQTGGFVEIRNEKYFNTKFLPNHNWRGYLFLYGNLVTENSPQRLITLTMGYEHESAHPTMGIRKNTSDAFIKIYDDVYRNINLNSLLLRYSRTHVLGKNSISGKGDYQFYFESSNTPELPGNTGALGHGLSLGFEYNRAVSERLDMFAAVFDRFIFRGKKEKSDSIYVNKGDNLSVQWRSYPIINEVNTVAVKAGLSLSLPAIDRHIEIYWSLMKGNIFGFVDSRDRRVRVAGGVCVSR